MADETLNQLGRMAPIGGTDRLVERPAGCWSCVWFRQGDEVLKEFMPEFEVALTRVKLSGTLRVPDLLADADTALAVSNLMHERGLSQEEATAEVERAKEQHVRRRLPAGMDPWLFDVRMKHLTAILAFIKGGEFGMCRGGGFGYKEVVRADGTSERVEIDIGKYNSCSHACRKWTGREGASVARGTDPIVLADELHALADEKASIK